MGIQERKQREREQRRELIIEAATKVFMKKGLTGATMEEIAAGAELSKATLYLYFTNKEELFLAVLIIVLEKFIEVMGSKQSDENSVQDNLTALGSSYMHFYEKYPAYYKLLNTMEPSDDFAFDKYEISKEIAEHNTQIWRIVCAPIIKGIETGVFKADTDPLAVGMTLWVGSTGIINLMSHIHCSPHHEKRIEDLPPDAAMNQVQSLDYRKMLADLWEAIINYITNNKLLEVKK